MSVLVDILTELRAVPGIKGTALVTPDGLIIQKLLDDKRDDALAALTSFLLMTAVRSLDENDMGDMHTYVLQATNGRVVFASLQDSYLVTLLDQFADLGKCKNEILNAVHQLHRTARVE